MVNWYRKGYNTLRVDTKHGVIGLFYDSWSGLMHAAFYVPYAKLPSKTLCERNDVNFAGTGEARKVCPECLKETEKIIEND